MGLRDKARAKLRSAAPTGERMETQTLVTDPGRWDDLTVRLGSGIAIGVLGVGAIVAGGVWFQMLAVFAAAVMIWELWMMIAPDAPTPAMLLAAFVASVLSGLLTGAADWAGVLFIIAPILGALALKRERRAFLLFALEIQIAAWALVVFRVEYGLAFLLWIVLVVVATDVFGYFAGKALGGKKFWPAISPKKTWSGTIAGWIAAMVVGIIFWIATDAGFLIVLLSPFVSLAGQMGDIAESALKRRMEVKDSSALIPGHGGLFDRFDAMLGAALFLLVIVTVFGDAALRF